MDDKKESNVSSRHPFSVADNQQYEPLELK